MPVKYCPKVNFVYIFARAVIMYLLTEWAGRTGKYLARGHGVRTERAFSLFFFFFRVTKFGMFTDVAHFDRKVGVYIAIATKLF